MNSAYIYVEIILFKLCSAMMEILLMEMVAASYASFNQDQIVQLLLLA